MAKKFLGDVDFAAGIKISSGTPGASKVLTSDGSGNATWQAAPGGGTIDAIPTNGSTNAVQSDGVFDALALKVAYGEQDLNLLIMQALGSAIKAQTFGATLNSINAIGNLTDGRMEMVAVYLPVAATLTGVKFFSGTAGNFTGDNTNSIGLFSYSAGTVTKVAETANDANIWKGTSNTWQTVAFSSTYAAAAGLYYVALIYNNSAQTIAPAIGICASMQSGTISQADFTNSAKIHSFKAQSTLPSSTTMSTMTAQGSVKYVALY